MGISREEEELAEEINSALTDIRRLTLPQFEKRRSNYENQICRWEQRATTMASLQHGLKRFRNEFDEWLKKLDRRSTKRNKRSTPDSEVIKNADEEALEIYLNAKCSDDRSFLSKHKSYEENFTKMILRMDGLDVNGDELEQRRAVVKKLVAYIAEINGRRESIVEAMDREQNNRLEEDDENEEEMIVHDENIEDYNEFQENIRIEDDDQIQDEMIIRNEDSEYEFQENNQSEDDREIEKETPVTNEDIEEPNEFQKNIKNSNDDDNIDDLTFVQNEDVENYDKYADETAIDYVKDLQKIMSEANDIVVDARNSHKDKPKILSEFQRHEKEVSCVFKRVTDSLERHRKFALSAISRCKSQFAVATERIKKLSNKLKKTSQMWSKEKHKLPETRERIQNHFEAFKNEISNLDDENVGVLKNEKSTTLDAIAEFEGEMKKVCENHAKIEAITVDVKNAIWEAENVLPDAEVDLNKLERFKDDLLKIEDMENCSLIQKKNDANECIHDHNVKYKSIVDKFDSIDGAARAIENIVEELSESCSNRDMAAMENSLVEFETKLANVDDSTIKSVRDKKRAAIANAKKNKETFAKIKEETNKMQGVRSELESLMEQLQKNTPQSSREFANKFDSIAGGVSKVQDFGVAGLKREKAEVEEYIERMEKKFAGIMEQFEKMANVEKRLANVVRRVQNEIPQNKEDVKEELRKIEEELSKVDDMQVESLRSEKSYVSNNIKRREGKFEEIMEQVNKINKIDRQLEITMQIVENESLKDSSKIQDKFETLERELGKVNDMSVPSLSNEKEYVLKDIKRKRDKFKEITEKSNVIEEIVNQVGNVLQELRKEVPRNVEQVEKELEQRKQQLSRVDDLNINSLSNKKRNGLRSVEEMEEKFRRIAGELDKIVNVEKRLDSIAENIQNNLENEIERVKVAFGDLEEELSKVEDMEVDSLAKEKDCLKKNMKRKQARCETIVKSLNEMDEIEKQLDDLQLDIKNRLPENATMIIDKFDGFERDLSKIDDVGVFNLKDKKERISKVLKDGKEEYNAMRQKMNQIYDINNEFESFVSKLQNDIPQDAKELREKLFDSGQKISNIEHGVIPSFEQRKYETIKTLEVMYEKFENIIEESNKLIEIKKRLENYTRELHNVLPDDHEEVEAQFDDYKRQLSTIKCVDSPQLQGRKEQILQILGKNKDKIIEIIETANQFDEILNKVADVTEEWQNNTPKTIQEVENVYNKFEQQLNTVSHQEIPCLKNKRDGAIQFTKESEAKIIKIKEEVGKIEQIDETVRNIFEELQNSLPHNPKEVENRINNLEQRAIEIEHLEVFSLKSKKSSTLNGIEEVKSQFKKIMQGLVKIEEIETELRDMMTVFETSVPQNVKEIRDKLQQFEHYLLEVDKADVRSFNNKKFLILRSVKEHEKKFRRIVDESIKIDGIVNDLRNATAEMKSTLPNSVEQVDKKFKQIVEKLSDVDDLDLNSLRNKKSYCENVAKENQEIVRKAMRATAKMDAIDAQLAIFKQNESTTKEELLRLEKDFMDMEEVPEELSTKKNRIGKDIQRCRVTFAADKMNESNESQPKSFFEKLDEELRNSEDDDSIEVFEYISE